VLYQERYVSQSISRTSTSGGGDDDVVFDDDVVSPSDSDDYLNSDDAHGTTRDTDAAEKLAERVFLPLASDPVHLHIMLLPASVVA
jgi:hypothetical protein